jgi:hypothetical protein
MRRRLWILYLCVAWAAYCQSGPNPKPAETGQVPPVTGPIQDTFTGVDRIVAIGDIHGDFDRLMDLLRTAQLIDRNNVWSGGTTHLVLTGDFLDRGPASRKVMDLLIDLEPQALRAGGMVHALIGNHEAMNVYGDLRYVSNADFESYRAGNSRELRDQAFALILQDMMAKHSPPRNLDQFRRNFEKERPLGLVEQRIYFSPEGKYGQWLRRQNAVIQINDVVFVHGGISPKYGSKSHREMNERVREELDDASKRINGIVEDPEGPLWYRELASASQNNRGLNNHLSRYLERHDARRIVIGHTIMPAILPRFGGKVITIDVGLSRVYRARPGVFLLVEGGKYYVVYTTQRVELPLDSGNLMPYLIAAHQEDPANPDLRKLVRNNGR